jgi:hypothetical protein
MTRLRVSARIKELSPGFLVEEESGARTHRYYNLKRFDADGNLFLSSRRAAAVPLPLKTGKVVGTAKHPAFLAKQLQNRQAV